MRRVLPLLLVAACALAWVWTPTDDGSLPTCWVERAHGVYLGQDGSVDVAFGEAESAFEDSLETWNAPACSDWEFVYEGTTSDTAAGFDPDNLDANTNVVVWNETDFITESFAGITMITFDPNTGRIYDADVELNGTNFSWSVGQPGGDTFEVADVLTHELGHFLGLGHSEVAQATMAAGGVPGETHRQDLESDDIDGLCTIYPEGGVTPDCPVGAAGDDDDGWDDSDCTCSSSPSRGGLALLVLVGLALRRRAARSR